MIVEAVSVEARRRGDDAARPASAGEQPPRRSAARARPCACIPAARGTTWPAACARTCGPATWSTARRSSPRRMRPRSSSPAGGPRHDRGHIVLNRIGAARREGDGRHAGGPGACWRCSTTCSCTSPSRWALRLQNTAYSVNIKERLDFSCALFDAEGKLIANAPHMPVHLGSMGESIETVIRRNAGSHAAGRRLRAERPVPRRHAPAGRHGDHAGVRRGGIGQHILFYVGLPRPPRRHRRHHARLDAAVLHPHRGGGRADRQLQAGRAAACCARRRCGAARSGQYPSRNPEQNMADLRAQIAANEKGVAGAAQDGRRSSAWTWCRPTCAMCRTTPRRRCAA